jgi:hypothetical protein
MKGLDRISEWGGGTDLHMEDITVFSISLLVATSFIAFAHFGPTRDLERERSPHVTLGSNS